MSDSEDQKTHDNLGSQIFQWTGVVLCILYYFSPFVKIRKLQNGSLTHSQMPRLFITFSFLNTLFWTGVRIQTLTNDIEKQQQLEIKSVEKKAAVYLKDPLFIGNSISTIILYSFIVIWFYHRFQFNKLKASLCGSAVGVFIILVIACSFIETSYVEQFGDFTSVINALMYVASYEHVKKAKEDLDVELIQLHISLAMFAQSLPWFMSSFYKDKNEKGEMDWNLFYPNLVGILCGLGNFVAFVYVSVKANKSNAHELIYAEN